jgi:RNA polymerase sigma-70 factor (ECF subfamily)
MRAFDRTLSQDGAENIDIDCLVQEYYPYIRRLALSILNDPHEAEDATQETFIAAHHSLAEYRGHSQVKTWLTAIAVNACRSRLRKRKVRQTLASQVI